MTLGDTVYRVSPVWLQDLLISAYGARLQWLRYGPTQRAMLESLRRSQWEPSASIQQRQLSSLNTLLATAAAVPFYRDRGAPPAPVRAFEDLQELPLLTKAEVQQAGRALISAGHRGRRLLEIHTGGTTGRPLTIYCDRPTLQRNYAFFGRFREWTGVRRNAKVATFAGRPLVPEGHGGPFWRRNLAANTLLFSSYHIGPATLDAYVEALARFGPELIDSYPSSIEPIARHLLGRPDLRVRPRAVITSSETLSPETRAIVEQAFRTRVFDHYGAAEMAAFITQCESGSYHVNPEFGIVEILHDGKPVAPGESGEIVATGFINPVMPLIRYATGDRATLGPPGCPCARAFPRLEGLEGRMDDVVVTPEGHLVGRLDPIFKAVSTLHETRIVQDAPDHVRVEVVVQGTLAESERNTLLDGLRARLGPRMRIDIQQLPKLERTAGGKLRTVVNLVPRGHSAGRTTPQEPE